MKIKLFAPEKYWRIPEEIRDNWGCGPGGVGDYLVPDSILGLNVKPACQIHDYYYRKWPDPSEDARAMADRIFKWNMIRILESSISNESNARFRFLYRARLYLIGKYFRAVRDYGGPAWHDERNEEKEYREVKVTQRWTLKRKIDV